MPRHAAAHRHSAWTKPTGCYPERLLPELQAILAALADIGFRHEMDREKLQAWGGPEAIKERFIAQLDERYQRDRQPYMERLEQLQREIGLVMRSDRLADRATRTRPPPGGWIG